MTSEIRDPPISMISRETINICPIWSIGSNLQPWKKRINPAATQPNVRSNPENNLYKQRRIIPIVLSVRLVRIKNRFAIVVGIERKATKASETPKKEAQFIEALTMDR